MLHTYVAKRSQEPSCSELISELKMIQAWLPALASLDEDFDVDLTEGNASDNFLACTPSFPGVGLLHPSLPGEDALLTLHQTMMEVEAETTFHNCLARNSSNEVESSRSSSPDSSRPGLLAILCVALQLARSAAKVDRLALPERMCANGKCLHEPVY